MCARVCDLSRWQLDSCVCPSSVPYQRQQSDSHPSSECGWPVHSCGSVPGSSEALSSSSALTPRRLWRPLLETSSPPVWLAAYQRDTCSWTGVSIFSWSQSLLLLLSRASPPQNLMRMNGNWSFSWKETSLFGLLRNNFEPVFNFNHTKQNKLEASFLSSC